MVQLALTRRLRATPFTARLEAAGVKAYSVYNHMLLPAMFTSLEDDYRHLKSAVQLWDVSCERQVEIFGPDAARLVQLMTPRDLSRQVVGQCTYAPTVDARGHILNDPVTIKLAEDRFWVSVADSDIILYAKGLATGFGLAVTVQEPDIHPLAIQGPRADDLAAAVFGDAVRDIRFFRFGTVDFGGRQHLVSRSGYSVQGGFEVYLNGSDLGEPLWDALMEAGQSMDVRAGGPNLIERIEGGLLSFGSDMTSENTPYEAGLGKYCAPDRVACIGRAALLAEAERGPARIIRPIAIDGPPMSTPHEPLPLLAGNRAVGQVTSAVFSPDYGTNVALGMVASSHWDPGTTLEVRDGVQTRQALVRDKPFAG